jgi:Zn-finger nucleic acid-binding protein
MPPSPKNCPVCKTIPLGTAPLEPDLVGHPCPQCRGNWIAPKDYWKWVEAKGPMSPELPPAEHPLDLPVKETETPKFCPDCGRFLRRHRIGHGMNFSLDRCGTCGGFWLDANEWEILKSRHVHDRLHFVASDAWQAEVARQERERGHEQIVREKLGAEDLEKIKAIKVWIEAHPRKAELYAVLLDKKADPKGEKKDR